MIHFLSPRVTQAKYFNIFMINQVNLFEFKIFKQALNDFSQFGCFIKTQNI